MAQIDCLQNISNDHSEENDECTPSKRLKQARLPFKTIDHKAQIISPKANSASKKRKLSDAESPSAKVLRTPKSVISGDTGNNLTQTTVTNETEVSSSSEAEHVKTRVRNTLERFVRKSSQEEITSSTNTECIDLTDSEDVKESDSSFSFVDTDTCKSKKIVEFFNVKEKPKDNAVKQESLPASESNNTDKNVEESSNAAESTKDDENLDESLENKENMDVSVESETDPADISATEAVTPGKGSKLSTSLMKTPVSSKRSPKTETTPMSQSPGDSQSDDTPKSGRKSRSKLSEAKQKEREALKQKIKEEKLKALEEKKKQKEEERIAKEKEREKQRLEREAAKAEKERQKKEEKEKKEKERLEKLQQKEEEQKKKKEEIEAKLEEKRKKDEEKRLKEEEKQKENEEKLKKEQKVKQAFQRFFIKSNTSPTSTKPTKEQSGLFMPFQVKENTRLAPGQRGEFSESQKELLDDSIISQKCSDLYLSELKKGKRVGKSGKTFPRILADDDVELLVHDSETVKKVTYKCKLLQFHMNYRPPYYGTWTKKAQNVGPRTPFKTDTDLLDYEYDSDDDWEEEEPGESLSDCEDDDEKDEDVKEEEGDGWMVPHGYLSDDEGVDDDEEVTPEVLKMRREAKAEQWESELQRQTKPVLPQIIGCVWEQATHALQEEISKQLEQYKAVQLLDGPIPTSYCEPVKSVKGEQGNSDVSETPKVNPQRKPVPEEAMPDLIRLVHGNLMGIKKLIREFRLFWKSKTNPDSSPSTNADVSMDVDDSEAKTSENNANQELANKSINIENDAIDTTDCAISKRQLEIKINAIAVREKRQDFKKICWYVNDEVLKQYDCVDLPVPSAWESLIRPAKTPAKVKNEDATTSTTPGRKTPVPSITQFARPMSPSTIAAQHAAAQAKLLAAQAEKKKEMEALAAEKKEEKMDVTENAQETLTPQNEIKKVPVDQRKLTEFTNAVTSPRSNIRRIVPIKIADANNHVNSESTKKSDQSGTIDNNLKVKPVEKSKIPVKVATTGKLSEKKSSLPNGVITDHTGENSQEAIILD